MLWLNFFSSSAKLITWIGFNSYFYYCYYYCYYYYYYYYYHYYVKFSTGILPGGEIAPSGLPASLTPNPMHLQPMAPLLSLISRSFESLLPGLGTFHTFQFLSAEYYYLREQLCPQWLFPLPSFSELQCLASCDYYYCYYHYYYYYYYYYYDMNEMKYVLRNIYLL